MTEQTQNIAQEPNALVLAGTYDISKESIDKSYEEKVDVLQNKFLEAYKNGNPEQRLKFVQDNGLGFLVEKKEDKYILPSTEVIQAVCEDWAKTAVEGKTSAGIVAKIDRSLEEIESKGLGAAFYLIGETTKMLEAPYESDESDDVDSVLNASLSLMDNDIKAVQNTLTSLRDVRSIYGRALKLKSQIDIGKLESGDNGGYVTEDGNEGFTVGQRIQNIFGQDLVASEADVTEELESKVEGANDFETFQLVANKHTALTQAEIPLYNKVRKEAVKAKANSVRAAARAGVAKLKEATEENGVQLNDNTVGKVAGIDEFKSQKEYEARTSAEGRALTF